MDNIRLVTRLPATPEDVYDAWLSSLRHTAMTGAPATSEARVGATHTAWDGYISGEHVELEPSRRIVQTWRTTEFPEGAPDSLLEIVFVREGAGTRLTLIQNGIPDGQGEMYHEGWQSHYFAPMRVYFASALAPTRAKKAASAAKAKRSAKAKTPAKKVAPRKAKKATKSAKKAKPRRAKGGRTRPK
jgi:activator of HSP90 ATPase